MTDAAVQRSIMVALTSADLADGMTVARDAAPRPTWRRDLQWTILLGCTFVWLRGVDIGIRPAPVVAACVLLLASGARPAQRLWSRAEAALLLRQRPHLRAPMALAWDDEGFTVRMPGMVGRIAWTDVSRWSEGRAVLVFASTGLGAVYLPKRLIDPAQADDLKELARQHGVPGRGAPDARPPRDVLAAFEAAAPRDEDMPAAEGGSVMFQITRGEARQQVRREILARFVRARNLASLGLGAVALAGLLRLMHPRDDLAGLAAALAGGLALAFVVQVILPLLRLDRLVEQTFAGRRDLSGDTRLWWDADRTRIASETLDTTQAWSGVRRWREDRTAIHLDLARGGVQFVPKRALTPDELADLRRCARAAGVRGA